MSMVINLVEDHNIYLCEGGPVYNGSVQPSPTTYLTQWKIVGNSEVHGNEIWSCGEYNPTDGKYHILVQPLGGSIADIALDEPLRKVNNVADTLEYPTETSGKALLTIRVEESGGELSPLNTPTTELIDAPQIAEAESYSCVISQGGKAVSWSEFITDRESLYAYGVEWDKTAESPICTRIGNMELHKASKLPVQNAMRGCLLNDNGEVVQYLSDSDWQNNSLLDGSQGQVMIEIPDFYWKFSEDANGIQSVMLSMVEIEGYKKVNKMYVSAYQAALDRTNLKLASVKNNTAQYRGGNNTSSWDEDSQKTLLGKPVTNVSLTNFRTYARNRKANSTEWNCNTYLIQKVLYWLFVVEFATRNTQEAIDSTLTTEGYHKGGLGSGVTNVNDITWNSYNSRNPFVACGYTDSLGNGTGQVSLTMPLGTEGANITVQVPRYRGIENPFGHVWEWTDGMHVKVQSETDGGESQVYVSYDPATWNDNNYTGYTYIGNEARSNNWVKEILFGADGDIMCKTNGTGNTYYCDYHYTNIPTTTALRCVLFGGASIHSSAAGFVCSRSDNGSSTAAALFGSRLCFLPASEQTEA